MTIWIGTAVCHAKPEAVRQHHTLHSFIEVQFSAAIVTGTTTSTGMYVGV